MDDYGFSETPESRPGEQFLAVLHKYFGHSQFRPLQWKIIQSIIEDKRDLCVVMPTGYGKSLCYQFPAVYTGGVVLVISPLISLMKDQVLSLEMANIPACYLGSAQERKSNTVQNILCNEYRLVYITPEMCTNDYGSSLLEKMSATLNIVLIAIDEAHCVSQWGFDFRSSYRKLGTLRNIFPDIPLLAVTATATNQVCKDICSSLNLRNPQIIKTDFDRPNLYLRVSLKGQDIFSDIRMYLKRIGLKWSFPGSTIIYCPTKKMAETVASVLNDNAVKCSVYHGELSMKKRNEVHENFVRDEIQAISATVAFGMGIDKPDVRLVIHYGAPRDIELYYQEIGRAGRDGLPSTCHVFYSPGDFTVNKYFLSSLSGEYLKHRLKTSKLIENYLDSLDCRRDMIITYFQPERTVTKPEDGKCKSNCCDNCTNRLFRIKNNISLGINIDKTEFKNDALLLLRAASVLDGKGLTIPIFLLRGSKSQRLPVVYYKHKLFGAGNKKSEAWWKAMGRFLIKEDLLEQRMSFGNGRNYKFPILKISEDGREFIRNPETFVFDQKPSGELLLLAKTEPSYCKSKKTTSLPPRERMSNLEGTSEKINIKNNACDKPAKAPLSKEESELLFEMYHGLMKMRTDLAMKYSCMPYMIANNKMLMDLAKLQPKNVEELPKIEGFAQNKVDKFGIEIIEKISKLLENIKNKRKDKSADNNDNEFQDNTVTDLSKSSCSENSLWGKEDDSFMMTLPYQILPDFEQNNDDNGNDDVKPVIPVKKEVEKSEEKDDMDELWPDLDLSTVEELIEPVNSEHILMPSASEIRDINQPSFSKTFDCNKNFNCSSFSKRKSKMLEYEDSDDSDSDEKNKKRRNVVPHEKKKTISVISKQPLPRWIIDPDAKALLKKQMKTNSLFKI